MIIPSVKRIAPKLTCCAKCIWWATCYIDRNIVLVKLEKFWISPCICTVKSNIDWDISDDLYSLFVGICLKGCPLLEEKILIRDCSSFEGLGPGWYRTAVRTAVDNDRLLFSKAISGYGK